MRKLLVASTAIVGLVSTQASATDLTDALTAAAVYTDVDTMIGSVAVAVVGILVAMVAANIVFKMVKRAR